MPMQMQGMGAGMWRQGEILVVTRGLVFPERCPITNEPANTRYSYEFSYLTPEARTAGAMFGALGAALAHSMATKANYEIALSDAYVGAYRSNLMIGLGGLFGGIAAFIAGAVALAGKMESVGIAFLILGGLGVLGGIIWLVATQRDMGVHFVSDTHCWVSGCGPEFLNTLPPWPYEPK